MGDDKDRQRSKADADIEREIRQGRKFTPQEAIGRMIGPGSMKGGSAVSRVQAAEIEIETWLRSHLKDSSGALQALLPRQLKGSTLLLDNLDPATLAQAVGLVAGRVPTEASGGVRLDTIGAIAATGVTYVSVGRLTQSAPAADIGLDFTPL